MVGRGFNGKRTFWKIFTPTTRAWACALPKECRPRFFSMTSFLGRRREVGVPVKGLRANATSIGRKPDIKQFECPLGMPGHSKSKCAHLTQISSRAISQPRSNGKVVLPSLDSDY